MCVPSHSAQEKKKQEDLEFKVIHGYVERVRLAWAARTEERKELK